MRHGLTTVRGWRGCAVVAVALAICLGGGAGAQATVAISGSPSTLRIQTATAGAQPNPVTDNSTTYTIVIIGGPKDSKKITAQLSAPMPAGVTLKATFAVSASWISIPNVSLDATARDVVTGLDKTNGSTNAISYTLSATLAAGVVPVQSRMVTLTVVNTP